MVLFDSYWADYARGKTAELIAGFVPILETWPASEVNALPLEDIDIYADSAPSINRISLLLDDFVKRL